MTETKKRYSQTDKDALAIKWAKERLRIYLLGAPRFRIVTAHKPLVPALFNKVKAKVPPRIVKEMDHGNARRGLRVSVRTRKA